MATDAEEPAPQRPPYLRYAFHNLYNYGMMGGVAAASLLTQQWWMAVVGGGMEALWLMFAPDSGLLRRFWFDKVHAGRLAEEAVRQRQRLLAALPAEDRDRVTALDQKRATLRALQRDSDTVTARLLDEEIAKIDKLAAGFLDLIVAARRYQGYLATLDLDRLEKEMRTFERNLESARDPEERRLLQKNLEVVHKRRDRIVEIRGFITRAQGQMKLIENTLALLADQVVTMRSPKELGGQLDELMDGVEAVRSAARETEAMMQANAH